MVGEVVLLMKVDVLWPLGVVFWQLEVAVWLLEGKVLPLEGVAWQLEDVAWQPVDEAALFQLLVDEVFLEDRV